MDSAPFHASASVRLINLRKCIACHLRELSASWPHKSPSRSVAALRYCKCRRRRKRNFEKKKPSHNEGMWRYPAERYRIEWHIWTSTLSQVRMWRLPYQRLQHSEPMEFVGQRWMLILGRVEGFHRRFRLLDLLRKLEVKLSLYLR